MKRSLTLAALGALALVLVAAGSSRAAGVFGNYMYGRGMTFGPGSGNYMNNGYYFRGGPSMNNGYFTNSPYVTNGYYYRNYNNYPAYGYGTYPYTYGQNYGYSPNAQALPPYQSSYYAPSGNTSNSPRDPNQATIEVRVPADAELWFDGDDTQQRGSDRVFVTPSLKPGKGFYYDLKARWTDANGKTVERTRTVDVHAGDHVTVDFLRR